MKDIILSLVFFVVIILLIFIIVRLILNQLKYFKKRKIIKNILSALSAILIYFLFSVLFFNSLTKIPEEKFDETVWKENVSERHKMIDDLLESEYLIGKSKSKINDVFGKPKRVLEKGQIFEYELVGKSWADFKVINLKLYFKNNSVNKFEYFPH